jgi:uncharacterized protein YecE (DUF72 family)
VYLKDVPAAVTGQVWERFLCALAPLRQAGKLGAILLQFPPWFGSPAHKDYLVSCAARAAPDRVRVEFRNQTWMSEHNRAETVHFLTAHRLPYACVDMPEGYPNSIPPVLAATAPLAVVRFHGRSAHWDSDNIYERFGYHYALEELNRWAPKIRGLASHAEITHVLFNKLLPRLRPDQCPAARPLAQPGLEPWALSICAQDAGCSLVNSVR